MATISSGLQLSAIAACQALESSGWAALANTVGHTALGEVTEALAGGAGLDELVQVTDNRDGIVNMLDYEIQSGMPPTLPAWLPPWERIITATGLVPEAGTADRGYGQASVDAELEALGVRTIAILRKGKPGAIRRSVEAGDDFVELRGA